MFKLHIAVGLLVLVLVLVSVGQVCGQEIFGLGASLGEVSLVKGEPHFRWVTLTPVKSRITVGSYTAPRYELHGKQVVEYRPAQCNYPSVQKTTKKTRETHERRYLLESLDGKQVTREAFVKMLKGQPDGKLSVLMLEAGRVISPFEKSLLHPNLVVVRLYDMTVRWHYGKTTPALPPMTIGGVAVQ